MVLYITADLGFQPSGVLGLTEEIMFVRGFSPI